MNALHCQRAVGQRDLVAGGRGAARAGPAARPAAGAQPAAAPARRRLRAHAAPAAAVSVSPLVTAHSCA